MSANDQVVIQVPDYGYVIVDQWSWENIDKHQSGPVNSTESPLYQFTAKVAGLRSKSNPEESIYIRCVAIRNPDKHSRISLAADLDVGLPVSSRDVL